MKDLDFELIKAFKKANNQILKQESELVKEYNLTAPQYNVLETLYKKGSMCINDLIERLFSTSGNMTVIIKNLEKLGYITKECNENDRRVCNITLTKEGKDLIDSIYPKRKKQVRDFASTLSDSELNDLMNLLYKFKKRYKEEK